MFLGLDLPDIHKQLELLPGIYVRHLDEHPPQKGVGAPRFDL